MPILTQTINLLLLSLGSLLIAAEAVIPGASFIVIGVTMFVTGLVSIFAPFGGSIIFLTVIFLLTGVTTMYAYRQVSSGQKSQTINTESSLEGEYGIVSEEVTENNGKVNIKTKTIPFRKDDEMQARCKYGSIEEGTEVIVTDSGGGNILTVAEKSTRTDRRQTNTELKTNTKKDTRN